MFAFICCGLSALALAQEVAREGATERGWVTHCKLIGWNEQGPRWERGPGDDPARVLRWGRAATSVMPAVLVLSDGSRVSGNPRSLSASGVEWEGIMSGPLSVDWENVATIVWGPAGTVRDVDALIRWGAGRRGTADQIRRIDGTVVTGRMHGPANEPANDEAWWRSGDSAVHLVTGTDTSELDVSSIAAVVPSPALRARSGSVPRWTIELSDGSRLQCMAISNAGLVRCACGVEVQITGGIAWWEEIVGLMDREPGRWIVDEEPQAVAFEPVIPSRQKEPLLRSIDAIDARFDWQNLLVPTAIGMVPKTQAAYRIPKDAGGLLGEVSVLGPRHRDSGGSTGKLQFRILSGPNPRQLTERWKSGPRTVLDPVERVDVEWGELGDAAELLVLVAEGLDAHSTCEAGIWLDLRWK